MNDYMKLKSENSIPPKLAQRFLHWFLRDDLAEEVQSDLEEKYYATVKKKSLFKAKLNYWFRVLNYPRPLRSKTLQQLIHN
jgi:hypothetical protein